jgi:hypothetical protein
MHDWPLKIPPAMAFCLFSAWTGNHGPLPMLMAPRWKISCDALFLDMTKRFLAIVHLSLTNYWFTLETREARHLIGWVFPNQVIEQHSLVFLRPVLFTVSKLRVFDSCTNY